MPMLQYGSTGGIVPTNWLPPHAMHNPANLLAYYYHSLSEMNRLAYEYGNGLSNLPFGNVSGAWNLTHDVVNGFSRTMLPPASHPGTYADTRSLVNFAATAPFHVPRGVFHAFSTNGHPWNQEHATDHLSGELQNMARRVTSHFR